MRKVFILIMILSLSLTVGCGSNKESDSSNENSEEITKVEEETTKVEEETTTEEVQYNEFIFFENKYINNEDINQNTIEDEIVNGEKAYEKGKYIEVDFAFDILEQYLYGNPDVFNYSIILNSDNDKGYELVSENEKAELTESLNLLREQMYLSEESPVYFRPSKVVYQGVDENIDNSVVIKIYGHVSSDNVNFVSLSSYTITIVKDKDKLLANIV